MADDARQSEHWLINSLRRHPQRYCFWQAVRILRQTESRKDSCVSMKVSDEKILFTGNPRMSYAKCDIESVAREEVDALPEWRMAVNFLSLYGTASPLPDHYSEEILYEGEDAPSRHFLDLFNHRLVSLYYEAWQKYRYFVQFQYDAMDLLSQRMYSLGGLSVSRSNLDIIDWQRLLNVLGMFTLANPSAGALTGVLKAYFNLHDIYVEEWVPSYLEIAPEQRARLGQANCRLAGDFSLGQRVQDITGKFLVHLRDLTLVQFLEFSPGGPQYGALRALITLMLRTPLQFDISINLGQEAVSPMTLAADCRQELGKNIWLGQPGLRDRNLRA